VESLEKETYRLIGAAMKVHRTLGPGLREVCYQRAMAIELRDQRIPHRREVPIPLVYNGESIGTFRADFDCFGRVLLELKAELFNPQQAVLQMAQYLGSSGSSVGLVLNFGLPSLQVKRVLPRRPQGDSGGAMKSAESGSSAESTNGSPRSTCTPAR
jgi:GxxExxY protein